MDVLHDGTGMVLAGDTLRVTVDNDVQPADSAWVELPYVFNG